MRLPANLQLLVSMQRLGRWEQCKDCRHVCVLRLQLTMQPFRLNSLYHVWRIGGWSWLQALGAALVALGVVIAQGLIPIGRR